MFDSRSSKDLNLKIFLLMLFCLSLLATVALSFGGDGSSSNPYQITNCNQLQNMSTDLTANYELISNVNCSDTSNWNGGSGFAPIGLDSTNLFNGTFDGNYNVISGLYIDRDTGGIGLFGKTGSGFLVEDVGVENVYMPVGRKVGGLVGRNEGTVENCYSTGFTNASYSVGGLVGENYGNISNSYSTASASAFDPGNYVAGLTGVNRGNVSNSYSTGNVTGAGSNIGGLIGLQDDGVCSNSFWDVNTSSQSNSACGTGKTTDQMKNVDTYTDSATTGLSNPWDFVGDPNDDIDSNDTWYMEDYPGFYSVSYEISSCGELQGIEKDLEGDYTLINDINCSSTIKWNEEKGFKPVGNGSNKFNGTFNGRGNYVEGLFIDRDASRIGLFGESGDSSIIKNLGLKYANISGIAYTGGLVGVNWGLVLNSYVKGSVSGSDDRIGGLVGYSRGKILNSYTTGSVTGDAHIGGLVGLPTDPVINCSSQANVEGNGNIGGLAGYNYGRISNSYTMGDVTGQWGGVGGLVGDNKGPIENSYATGFVSGGDYTGGLIGKNSSSHICTNSFWNVNTTGQATSAQCENGGKTTSEMKNIATYTSTNTSGLSSAWDFVGNPNDDTSGEDIWYMDGYPELTGISEPPYASVTDPQDGEEVTDLPTNITLTATVQNPSGGNMTVEFINENDNSTICSYSDVENGSTVNCTWYINEYTTHNWHIQTTTENGNTTQTDTYTLNTQQQEVIVGTTTSSAPGLNPILAIFIFSLSLIYFIRTEKYL